MSHEEEVEWLLFNGYDDNLKDISNVSKSEPFCSILEDFLDGHFEKTLSSPVGSQLLSARCQTETQSVEETLLNRVKQFLDNDEKLWERQFTILVLAATGLQLFVQNNWTGPPTKEKPTKLIPLLSGQEDYVWTQLTVDEEAVYVALLCPEYLWLAKTLLGSNHCFMTKCHTSSWWCMRYVSVHQQVLQERCPALFSIMFKEVDRVLQAAATLSSTQQELAIQLYTETFYISNYYYEHVRAKECLQKAQELTGLSVDLTGALGKRTRFQQKDIAQLTLKVQQDLSCRSAQPEETMQDDKNSNDIVILPTDLKLNDEVRLESVAFKDDQEIPKLCAVNQAVFLGIYTQIQRTNAVHSLVEEELMTYLAILLSRPQNWAIQSSCLLQRSKLESKSSRSVERSMMQIQNLVDQHRAEQPSASFRLRLIYCTPFPPYCIFQKELASMFCKLGAISSALDVYQHLQMWDEVIACYMQLQRREKAEAIVRQQLEVRETPTLWCHLGDATDNPEYYLKAWELSNQRSARAQKALGMLYFRKKEYKDSVSHFEQSLAINRMQLDAWFRLAYAALQIENWETAARAYRACLELDPENFEAWNNLSNAYIKLNQKARAFRTLQEALRCHYEDWRIWENYMLVSLDCGVFAEVIKAYHRILDLKEKHVDEEVLGILVRAVTEGILDDQGKAATELFHKLSEMFGRITAQVTNNGKIWKLYGTLVSVMGDSSEETLYKVVQYFQKSHRCALQTSDWEKNTKSCQEVLDLTCDLANAVLQLSSKSCCNMARNHLSAAKLALIGTLAKVRKFEESSISIEVLIPRSEVGRLEAKLQEVNEKLVACMTDD